MAADGTADREPGGADSPQLRPAPAPEHRRLSAMPAPAGTRRCLRRRRRPPRRASGTRRSRMGRVRRVLAAGLAIGLAGAAVPAFAAGGREAKGVLEKVDASDQRV